MRLPRLLAALAAVAMCATACSSDSPTTAPTTGVDVGDWDAVLAAADGQTVTWWLYGGDDRINSYIDDHVVPAAAALGVTLVRNPITDTADAVNRVLSEVRADQSSGSVDLIWINGENFANGAEASLWERSWATQLPNAGLVTAGSTDTDFGVDVDGQESAWSRALFIYAYDQNVMDTPPASFDELLAYATANPGRITYPAPPDFTGSAFVRQVVAAMGEDEAFAYLAELQPLLWQAGGTFPATEAELHELFGNGEVDLAMSYDPAFVETGVAQGRFAATTRPFVLTEGTLQNTSYVAMPANAPSRAGALVIANLLLDPLLQAIKADPAVLGVPTVLDVQALSDADQARFAAGLAGSEYLLLDYGTLVAELPADRVETVEQRWILELAG
jgi:putative spermidine/putrescine transport system substrate-binding protein